MATPIDSAVRARRARAVRPASVTARRAPCAAGPGRAGPGRRRVRSRLAGRAVEGPAGVDEEFPQAASASASQACRWCTPSLAGDVGAALTSRDRAPRLGLRVDAQGDQLAVQRRDGVRVAGGRQGGEADDPARRRAPSAPGAAVTADRRRPHATPGGLGEPTSARTSAGRPRGARRPTPRPGRGARSRRRRRARGAHARRRPWRDPVRALGPTAQAAQQRRRPGSTKVRPSAYRASTPAPAPSRTTDYYDRGRGRARTPDLETPYEDLLRTSWSTAPPAGPHRHGHAQRLRPPDALRPAAGLPAGHHQAGAPQVDRLRAAVVPARRHQRRLAAGARGHDLGRVGRAGRRARPVYGVQWRSWPTPGRRSHRPDRRGPGARCDRPGLAPA